ncbi:hypothetical protein [Streptomyces sp. NBC_01446]|uniref:hypothetical protein n=1 Tax=Streptomyces sp. NBC_01446 TaxID=2903870 RepID=UPI002257063F|nr:hypothetical protein [Streptomyces sp. NBC_01446]MCX4648261.1 hypothetical protein [Streptomyces sp. NBC_01446]
MPGLVRRRTGLAPGSVDLALSNAPYVATVYRRRRPHGPARAWEGGEGGRDAVDRDCATAHRALRVPGMPLMVHCERCGVAETIERLSALGMKARAVDRAQVPFGPVTRKRRARLCAPGVPGP